MTSAGHAQPVTGTEPVQHRGRALFGLLRAAWKEYEADYARYFAAAMVYYALISLIPLVLLLLGTLGLLLRESIAVIAAKEQVLAAIENNLGGELRATIDQLLINLTEGSLVATLISLAALVLSASLIIKHLRLSFRSLWHLAPPLISGSLVVGVRKLFMEKVIAFGMMMTGALLLVVALGFLGLINWMSSFISPTWLIAIPSALVIVPLTFALLFMYLPPVRVGWQNVWFATMLCACAWLIGVEVIALYGSFFGRNFTAFGVVGGMLVIMLWMHVVSQVLFFGAELCKVSYWWSSDAAPTQGALRPSATADTGR